MRFRDRPDAVPPGDPSAPLPHDGEAAAALITAGAFVALADGRVDGVERDELVRHVASGPFSSVLSRREIEEIFDHRIRRLHEPGGADLMADALRPLVQLSLGPEVIRIAERIAAADGYVDHSECRALSLLRLVMLAVPQPKLVG